MPRARLAQLTIYLLKEAFSSPEHALTEAARQTGTPVSVGGASIGDLYLEPLPSHVPSWARIFAEAALPAGFFPFVSGASAVFLVPAGGRLFALTFGQGRYLLAPGSWEERFGLLVTVNAIAPDSLRSLDRKTLDESVRHTREQVSRRSTIAAFGLNPEQDLLRAVAGLPADDSLGAMMTGMDALSVSAPVTLSTLPALLVRYLALFGAQTYQTHFSWIDHISEVGDLALKRSLDDALLARLATGSQERTWLAVPEVIEWDDVGGFRYGTSKRNDPVPDLHLGQFLDHVDGKPITMDRLRSTPVICYSQSTDALRNKWSVLQCLYCEVELNGVVYLLSGAKWYRVAQPFVDEVKAAYLRIPRDTLALPPCSETEELAYNTRVASSSGGHIALMDRKLIRVDAARDRVEFCDLYTRDRQVIHVKRYGASSVLSHLFAQGTVSGELLAEAKGFRQEVNALLPSTHSIPLDAIVPRDYEIVFAIVSRSQRDLDLPFFSKVSLRVAVKRLEARGYRVSLNKVSVP